jgi:hypothetical protein
MRKEALMRCVEVKGTCWQPLSKHMDTARHTVVSTHADTYRSNAALITDTAYRYPYSDAGRVALPVQAENSAYILKITQKETFILAGRYMKLRLCAIALRMSYTGSSSVP